MWVGFYTATSLRFLHSLLPKKLKLCWFVKSSILICSNRMERSRHVEDVSSSDEPDLKRPVSDNSASTTRKRESILKNVMVLFSCDVRKRDGKVYMPNTIEMARLKRPERGQFKTNIEFIKTMTEKDVKEKLRCHFSILGNNGR